MRKIMTGVVHSKIIRCMVLATALILNFILMTTQHVEALPGLAGALTSAPRPAPPGKFSAPRPAPPSAPGLAWASPSPVDPLTYFAQG